MKKWSLVFLCWFCGTQGIAQSRFGDQQFSIGYGQLTSDQLLDGTTPGLPYLSSTYRNYTNDFASGVFYFRYKCVLSRKVSMGIFLGYESERGQWYYNSGMNTDNFQAYPLGTFSRRAYTVAPELTGYYINNSGVRLYTSMGVGLTIVRGYNNYLAQYYNTAMTSGFPGPFTGVETTVPQNAIHVNGYYSPLGFEYKIAGRLWSNFEIGIGYKGIINGGIAWHVR
jgi:hypothetical protein